MSKTLDAFHGYFGITITNQVNEFLWDERKFLLLTGNEKYWSGLNTFKNISFKKAQMLNAWNGNFRESCACKLLKFYFLLDF